MHPPRKHPLSHFLGFTLTELIVVITILAILGTIGFMTLRGYSSSARDSDRLTTLKNIETGLSIFYAKTGTYPFPEAPSGGVVKTGSIDGVVYSHLGVIGSSLAGMIHMSDSPFDPLGNIPYPYAISSNKRYFQVAAVLENTLAFKGISVVPQTYANETYEVRVIGNYPGYFTFTDASGSVWLVNIPSLIWNNIGSVTLLSSNTYFVVNREANLPYTPSSSSQTPLQVKNGDDMVKALTNTQTATLTGVNITDIVKGTKTVEEIFGTEESSELLASFGGDVANIKTIILGASAGANAGNGAVVSEYSSGVTYKSGDTFTYKGSVVSVTGTGVGHVSGSKTVHTPTCDTDDIVIWQGGTDNVQIWAACNAGARYAYVNQSYPGAAENRTQEQKDFMGALYQWGRNNDITTSPYKQGEVFPSGQLPLSNITPENDFYGGVPRTGGAYDWYNEENNDAPPIRWNTERGGNNQGPCSNGYHVPSGVNFFESPDSTTQWGMLYGIVNSQPVLGGCNQTNVHDRITCILRLPMSGYRCPKTELPHCATAGLLNNQGQTGHYWAQNPLSYGGALGVYFNGTSSMISNSSDRAYGFSVRCIKNE